MAGVPGFTTRARRKSDDLAQRLCYGHQLIEGSSAVASARQIGIVCDVKPETAVWPLAVSWHSDEV